MVVLGRSVNIPHRPRKLFPIASLLGVFSE